MDNRKQQLLEMLNGMCDPSLDKRFKDTKGIQHLEIEPESDIATLILNVADSNQKYLKQLKHDITVICKLVFHLKGVKIQIDEFRHYESVVTSKTKFIGVISGKGGVGKSTVSCNLAYALKRLGLKVGLVDADIYGSSIPSMLEMEHQNPRFDQNKKIIPLAHDGIKVMSTEFLTNPGEPVIWRGGVLNQMLNHFFLDVNWQELDYMIIDLPPGTGDVALDVQKLVPQAKMLLVTTPHPSASTIALKAGIASQKMGHSIIGVIENLAYYQNGEKKDYIFGQGGGQIVADKLGIEVLASIPINQPLKHLCIYESEEPIGKLYDSIAQIIRLTDLM